MQHPPFNNSGQYPPHNQGHPLPNQVPFYNDQTQPHPTYPAYQPGQFVPFPQPPPKKNPWQWFIAQKTITKMGLGCGLSIILLLCSCVSLGAIAGSQTSASTAAKQAYNTAHTVTQTTAIPTTNAQISKPTPIITATPIPTQGLTSTPTAMVPTSEPTMATPVPTVPVAQPTDPPQPQPTAPPQPQPTAPPQPQPTQPPVTGVNNNPWGYDFNPGNLIYSVPPTFCQYFDCISNFYNGTGYVIECQDNRYSKSGGRSGSCSQHGGNLRPLYSH